MYGYFSEVQIFFDKNRLLAFVATRDRICNKMRYKFLLLDYILHIYPDNTLLQRYFF